MSRLTLTSIRHNADTLYPKGPGGHVWQIEVSCSEFGSKKMSRNESHDPPWNLYLAPICSDPLRPFQRSDKTTTKGIADVADSSSDIGVDTPTAIK